MRRFKKIASKSWKMQSNRKWVVLACLVAAAAFVQLASCSQRPASESSNQISSVSSGGGDYQSLVNEGLIGLASGQSLGGYSSKRARGKMSAFMPMRGRRNFQQIDGQPEFSMGSGNEQQQQQMLQFVSPSSLMLRETGDGEATILRLVAGSGPPEVRGARQLWLGAPRQFASQFAVQHNLQQQQQQLADEMDGGSGGSGGQMVALQAPLMQAKLRRAFHPMRGKKSSLESAIGVETSGDEGY